MTVTTPPRRPEVEHHRDLERRVADLEALIEEARRRARRRRARRGIAALIVLAGGTVTFLGFAGHGGGGSGGAATHVSHGTAANAGATPLAALPSSVGPAKAFAFDPRNPDIVYVLAVNYSGGAPRGRVFATSDGGAHWRATTRVATGWVGINESLTADPQHAGTLYVGTERAVYKTVDGGRSWRPSTRGLLAPPSEAYTFNRGQGWVTALAVDPADTNLVFAGSDRVSRSTNGGLSWTTVFPPNPTRYPAEHVSALAIARTRPETIYAIASNFANPAPTPASARTSIYESTDAGTTWQATTVVHGGVSPTALAIDPRHPATVYAAIAGDLLKTSDAGKSWLPIGHGLPVSHTRGSCRCMSLGGIRALTVDPTGTGSVYAALTQGGIYKSTNGGRTWVPALDKPLDFTYSVAVDPARPTTIYAAAQDQTAGLPQILRSTDRGRTWVSAP